MKKVFTQVSSDAESVTVSSSNLRHDESIMSPKTDTIERIRMFARVAFSDAAIAGLPLIVLN